MLVLDPRSGDACGLVDATTSTADRDRRGAARQPRRSRSPASAWSSPPARRRLDDAGRASSRSSTPTPSPILTFGAGSVTSVDPAGTLFAYTPSTGDVARVDAADSDTVADALAARAGRRRPRRADHLGRRAAGPCSTPARATSSISKVAAASTCRPARRPATTPVLQAPVAHGRRVAIAHAPGPHRGRARRRRPRSSSTGASGLPAAPVDARRLPLRGVGARRPRGAPARRRRRAARRARWRHGRRRLRVPRERRRARAERSAQRQDVGASADYRLIDNWDDLLEIERDEETVEENDPDDAAGDREEPGSAGGRRRRVRRPPGPFDAAARAAQRLRRQRRRARRRRGRRRAAARRAGSTASPRTSSCSSRSTTRHPASSPSATRSSDGRGGSARATVVVTVRDPDENAPPVQRRSTHAAVETQRARQHVRARRLGRSRRRPVLPPSGGRRRRPTRCRRPPMAWSSSTKRRAAEPSAPSRSSCPTAATSRSARLDVAVRAAGRRAAHRRPVRRARHRRPGDPHRSRCAHVRGGSGQIRLDRRAREARGRCSTPDFDGGSFRFTSAEVRTHYLEYTVTDGTKTATGIVRVDVSAPPERDTTPITVPHTAFVRAQRAGRRRRARDRHRPDRRRAHRHRRHERRCRRRRAASR